MMLSSTMAVLPVWRSPMISSRWPRPIGTRLSIALMPVCIGSLTDWRGMNAGRLDLGAAALDVLQRPLAVDRVAEPVDHAAEQAPADRHVDHGAGAVDGVALADRAVVAEDDDADMVALEGSSAMPRTPAPGNSTISPDMTFCKPKARAMPSPTDSTVPVSETSLSLSKPSICRFRMSDTSAGRISIAQVPFMA